MTEATSPFEIGAGLRRLADFVEAQGDKTPTVSVTLSTDYAPSLSLIQVAEIVEASDTLTVKDDPKAVFPAVVTFGDLRVSLNGQPELFVGQQTVQREITIGVPLEPFEIIRRGRDAYMAVMSEPF